MLAVSADNQNRVTQLLARSVVMPSPMSVEIAAEVDLSRISAGVVIHSGCRIRGARTSIGPGSVLGAEAPLTLEDCQLGRNVGLKGGFVSGATFLDGSSLGSGAQVRPGTLLEEAASGAHSVGLKQTVLLPFVTAGSLINFCDALMAGGTSRKNHSEIGSSYIHFNYTPHQDKATPSLVGDVPRGVMLDQAAIFLGGQGGLVGPVRIAYGSVIPAGVICRRDLLEEDRLYAVPPAPAQQDSLVFRAGAYRSILRVVRNNLIYIGNIQALRVWYLHVRKRLMTTEWYALACYEGAIRQLDSILDERILRLGELAEKMARSLEIAKSATEPSLPPTLAVQQQALLERWPAMECRLRAGLAQDLGAWARTVFLSNWEQLDAKTGYLEAVASLSPQAKQAGTAWLQAVTDSVASIWNNDSNRQG